MSSYSIGYYCGIVFAVVVGAFLVFFLMRWTRKDRSSKCKYDERQTFIRGNAYKIAFFTVIVLDFLYGALLGGDFFEVPVTTEAAMFMIATLGISVHIVYCIWNGAYYSLNEQKTKVLLIFLVIGGMNAVIGIKNLTSGNAFTDGKLNGLSMNLVVSIMFLIIFGATLFRKVVPEKIDEDEE